MTERLADITARIEQVGQLDAVVAAMRGIAAARAQAGRGLIAGIEAYTMTISRAIGQALSLAEPAQKPAAHAKDAGAVILFGAEQGFAGAFSDRVLDAAGPGIAKAYVLTVGGRCAAIARERGIVLNWTTGMASQVGAIPTVAGRTADALYAQIAKGRITHAELVFPRLDVDRRIRVEKVALFPLNLEQFRRTPALVAPLTTLPPHRLLEQLASEYIYARLCEAAMHAFAAENQARMDAMTSAGSNIDRMLADIRKQENQVRQEEVTAEIVELASGVEAAAKNRSARAR